MDFLRSGLVKALLICIAVLAAAGAARDSAFVTSLQHELTEARQNLISRPATGEIVFVAIDKQALDYVGVWPWPRRVHANIIDRLINAGARQIAFDIDFSHASNEHDDKLLAEALDRAGGSVVLASFRQNLSIADDNTEIASSTPINLLLQRAWPASVNVLADQDGVVRGFPFGQNIAGEFVPALAAMLAGGAGNSDGHVYIDFSIDPASIPKFSVKALLQGQIAPDALKGKTVVVGSSAVELGDTLAVPVHGLLSGAMVQILGAESLLQKRNLVPTNNVANTIMSLLALCLVFLLRQRLNFTRCLLALAATMVLLEVGATAAQYFTAINAETATLHLLLGCTLTVATGSELVRRRLRMIRTELMAGNYLRVLEQTFADSSDAVLYATKDEVVRFASSKAQRLFGRSGTEIRNGTELQSILPAAMLQDVRMVLSSLESGSGDRRPSTWSNGKTGVNRQDIEYMISPSRFDESDKNRSSGAADSGAVCITARDVTSERTRLEQIDHLSRHDALTGMLRRHEFVHRLEQSIEDKSPMSGHTEMAVVAFDIFNFSLFNNMFGRNIGDAILVETGNKAKEIAGIQGLVARTDSNTFVVASTNCPEGPDAFAERLLAAVQGQMHVRGHHIRLKVNAGGVVLPKHVSSASAAIAASEMALDQSKKASDATIQWFEPSLGSDVSRALKIETYLWDALENGELSVLFQPQVKLKDGSTTGAEALLRWYNAELGQVSPVEFIPIAERSGAIDAIGNFVLRAACRTAAMWPDNLSVAVNVSPVQLSHMDMLQEVRQVLAETGLRPDRLCLEITETALLEPTHDAVDQLKKLRSAGVKIAIDDFGTGHASFGYISRLPIDKIKIDRSFVSTMQTEPRSLKIIHSMLMLARELDFQSVCEGIEDAESSNLLRLAGGDSGQGYHFGRPLTASDFLAFVARKDQIHHANAGADDALQSAAAPA